MNFWQLFVVAVCMAGVAVFGSDEEVHVRQVRVVHERRRKMHFC
jgi:hypothetical protein